MTLANQIAEQIRFVDTFRKRTGTTNAFIEEARESLIAAGFMLGLGETALASFRQSEDNAEDNEDEIEGVAARRAIAPPEDDDDDYEDRPPARTRRGSGGRSHAR